VSNTKKEKPMTHVGMVHEPRRLGWHATDPKPMWLRETAKCWIGANGCRWPKEPKRSYGTTPPEHAWAKRPGGDYVYALRLDSVRPLTHTELRQPLVDAVETAKRRVEAAHARRVEAEKDREDAFEAGRQAQAELARFDKEHPEDG